MKNDVDQIPSIHVIIFNARRFFQAATDAAWLDDAFTPTPPQKKICKNHQAGPSSAGNL
jgi:hypothetical protein